MNSQLSISIPTFNRPKILESNLNILIPQAETYSVPIYISDDSSNNETKMIIKKALEVSFQ